MKLPSDAIIAIEKMTDYLLQWRPENDKSQFLAQAGYTEQHANRLARDIRRQLLTLEAEFEETTEYGEMYSIVGSLIDPNGGMFASCEHLDDRKRNRADEVHYSVPG